MTGSENSEHPHLLSVRFFFFGLLSMQETCADASNLELLKWIDWVCLGKAVRIRDIHREILQSSTGNTWKYSDDNLIGRISSLVRWLGHSELHRGSPPFAAWDVLYQSLVQSQPTKEE